MATIEYNDQSYSVNEEETVLDALLKNKIDYPYSCKTGTCQSCLTQLTDGEVNTEAQQGLKPTLIAQNYFLACQCKPKTDIKIKKPNTADTAISSKIIELKALNHNVLQIKLAIENATAYKAGQYINLITPDNLIRSYSIANIPNDNIEIHVKLVAIGLMSQWLTQHAKIGTPVHIRGPMGDCFYYNPTQAAFPIVLAGTGTGLAPLLGILRDALENRHNGHITLIHGGVSESDLYLHKTLSDLQQEYHQFTYAPCVLNESRTVIQASIENILVEKLKGIENSARVYICGPEKTTKKMKIKVFLAGVPSASIYSDIFITTT